MSGPAKEQEDELAQIKKPKRSKPNEWEHEKHEELLESINALTNQLAVNQQSQEKSDKESAFREKLTLFLVAFALLASVVGDVIFYRTLNAARLATKEAHNDASKTIAEAMRQATAAEAQLATTVDTAHRQLRAYIYEVGGHIEWINAGTYKVVIGYKNWGQTPAFKTYSWIRAGIAPSGFVDDSPPLEDGDEADDTGPGATFNMESSLKEVTPEQILALRSGTSIIYIRAFVRYVDIYGVTHRTVIRSRNQETELAKRWHLHTIANTKGGESD